MCAIGAVVGHELPLLYDAHARAQSVVADSLSAVLVYGSLAFVVLAGRVLLARLSEEHAVMRELATVVAAGTPQADVFVLASRRIASLLGVDGCGIIEFASSESAVVGGAWAVGDAPALAPGTILPLTRGDDLHVLYSEGRAVRVDRHGDAKRAARMGYGCSLTTPVQVRGRLWGAISVASVAPDSLPAEAERVLDDFAELIGLAVANTEAHADLVEQAATDPLTRLANHRAFHERLRDELSRALRHERPLTLALLDVDHFKAINDSLGHERGDVVLAAVAATLSDVARAEDVLARLGGDEFALLMPETDEESGAGRRRARPRRDRRHRARHRADASPSRPASAASSTPADPDSLVRLADGALYWGKAHGRDAAWVYDPEVVRELSISERADQLQRSQALVGIRALARAIDAKDQSTREHSQRVATLACDIARRLDWSEERVALLEDAALVHDVGKIGVPDAVLLKPGRLTDDEYDQIKRHAALGAQMVEDLLLAEQVGWIRAHHERPDGRGYPAGLTAAQIPDGAAILAVADAFDVMTATRIYSAARSREDALAECERLVGAQFAPEPVAALAAHVPGRAAHSVCPVILKPCARSAGVTTPWRSAGRRSRPRRRAAGSR